MSSNVVKLEFDQLQEKQLPEIKKPKEENKANAQELTPIALACEIL